MLLVVHLFDVK